MYLCNLKNAELKPKKRKPKKNAKVCLLSEITVGKGYVL
jgi:hypothetical protein